MAAALTLAALTAACAPATRSGPSAGAGQATSISGPQALSLDGVSYAVAIAPGPQGRVLTAQGAVPVTGQRVVVTRKGAMLGLSDGAVSKRVAKLGCEQAGGRFNGGALGRFAGAGTWTFDGVCA